MNFRVRFLLPCLGFLFFVAPPGANAQLSVITQHGEPLVIDASTDLVWADTPSPGGLWGPGTFCPSVEANCWPASLNTFTNADGTTGYGGYTDWYLASASQLVHL